MKTPQMLCYQCEQTSAGKGCTVQGICSKTPQLAGLQDLQVLYGMRLCQLAHALGPGFAQEKECRHLVLESVFATLTNVNFDDGRFEKYLDKAASVTSKMEAALEAKGGKGAVPPAPPSFPTELPSTKEGLLKAAVPAGILARGAAVDDDDFFGVVEMATYGFKGVAAYLYHAESLESGAYSEEECAKVFAELFRIGNYIAEAGSVPPGEDALNQALGECLAVGKLNLEVMKMLDAAHCHTLGTPTPTEVSIKGGGRPSILVSGHDLAVLKLLLEQSEGKGVDVYTHGEMLPAHGYPGLKKFEHLRGHFGTHWGNQLHEFKKFPGSILMTSNCLRPPTKKYADRIYCCGPVGFANIPNIIDHDFTPLIDRALALPAMEAGFPSNSKVPLSTGFGHGAVLSLADKVVGAVKSGQLKHIFVIGGCDGTESTRSYFTDLADSTPSDSLILTMGCGKFRLNNQDHGMVAGLPRLLDMGQCNDAYGAVVVATKLAEALGCGVHDLPLHFAVSWFEQKAVAVLLTLLHLELKNIRIGPAVPAFLTPKVLGVLQEKFGLQGISTDHEDDDLESMLKE